MQVIKRILYAIFGHPKPKVPIFHITGRQADGVSSAYAMALDEETAYQIYYSVGGHRMFIEKAEWI